MVASMTRGTKGNEVIHRVIRKFIRANIFYPSSVFMMNIKFFSRTTDLALKIISSKNFNIVTTKPSFLHSNQTISGMVVFSVVSQFFFSIISVILFPFAINTETCIFASLDYLTSFFITFTSLGNSIWDIGINNLTFLIKNISMFCVSIIDSFHCLLNYITNYGDYKLLLNYD